MSVSIVRPSWRIARPPWWAVAAALLLHLGIFRPWPAAAPPSRPGVASPSVQVRTLPLPPPSPPAAAVVAEAAVPAPAPSPPPPPRPQVDPPSPAAEPAPPGPPSPPAGSPLPLYRTKLPPSGEWPYRLRRAGQEGEARLQWQHDEQRYEARLEGRGEGRELQWVSAGTVGDHGLAPSRFVDRRDRRRQAANFDHEAGRIGYSGNTEERPLYPGGQDRLSAFVQLAAILQARRSPAAVGEEVVLQVSGARGDTEVWRFQVQGPERVTLADGSVRFALKLLREPTHPYDTRAEVWTDPAHHHLPLKLVMRNGEHVFELTLQRAP